MNYIRELRAFYFWRLHHELPTNASHLWHALMMINNALGWKKEFNATQSIIFSVTGLSKQAVSEARKQLVKKELIHYKPGKMKQAPVYEMISVSTKLPFAEGNPYTFQQQDQECTQHHDQAHDHTHDSPNDNTQDANPTIHKQELKQELKQKQNENSHQKELTPNASTSTNNNAITVYEQNFGTLSPIARENLLEWCERIGDEMVVAALNIAAKNGAYSFGYVEKILQDWSRARIEAVDQVEAYQQKRTQQKPKQKDQELHNLMKKLREEEW